MADSNLKDGFARMVRGVHSGLSPDFLASDQLAMAVNAALRGGVPRQRPGILRRVLEFGGYGTDGEGGFDLSAAQVQDNFEDGLWQGAGAYNWEEMDLLVASVSGRIYRIDLRTMGVLDITPQDDPNSAIMPQFYWVQAEMFGVGQDNQARPLIFNGAGMRRSNLVQLEVPVGNVMAYALGRLWVALTDRRSFVGGDLVGDPSGTPAWNYRDAVIKFTTNTYIVQGQVFTVGDLITGMKAMATPDTTLGQGPLQVFSATGSWGINAPFNREEWRVVTYPIQTATTLAHGASGPNSVVNINNDIWYRADDGIRSFQMARREANEWADTPMSYEMDRVIRFDQRDWLGHANAVLFDNRLLMSCSPLRLPLRGVVWRGLIALDFQETSSLQREGLPAYDGVWTGLRILQVLTAKVRGVERCWVFALDAEDRISLWELTRGEKFDEGGQRIQWSVDGPALRFGEEFAAQRRLKRLAGGRLFRSGLIGNVDFRARWRSDKYPLWQDVCGWDWTDCARQVCWLANCPDLAPNLEQSRKPRLLTAPESGCEIDTAKPAQIGYVFQARIEVTGPASLDMFRLEARHEPEGPYGDTADEPCRELAECPGTLFEYEIEG